MLQDQQSSYSHHHLNKLVSTQLVLGGQEAAEEGGLSSEGSFLDRVVVSSGSCDRETSDRGLTFDDGKVVLEVHPAPVLISSSSGSASSLFKDHQADPSSGLLSVDLGTIRNKGARKVTQQKPKAGRKIPPGSTAKKVLNHQSPPGTVADSCRDSGGAATLNVDYLLKPKYNRRNNPELEKRRIHFCDHPGKMASHSLTLMRC